MEWDLKRSDELLSIAAHGRGDEKREAFAAFYRRHHRYVFGICYNFANRCRFGHFDHEDLFQETMAKAYEHAKDFRADGVSAQEDLEDKVDAWLGGIARHVAADYLRRHPPCLSVDPVLLEENEQPSTESIEDFTDDAKLIRDAIDTLSPAEQAVIWASSQYYQRREHQRTPSQELDQILSDLGISRVNFRKLKERARKRISQYIASKKLPLPT